MTYQGNLLSKTLVIGIIFLFIGMSIIPTISSDTASSTTLDNDGSLLGYVNDTSGNPIEGALVRVYFHGTYEEDYSDSTGFYHVTNIHICNCTKNTTCSKEGYKTEWVLLGIAENTTYDFNLTSNFPPSAPIINGPTIIWPWRTYYYYTFVSTDPDDAKISYSILWAEGDSLIIEQVGPYPSGEEIILSHNWHYWMASRCIFAIAKDASGLYSDETRFVVTIPRHRTTAHSLFQCFFERFPLLEVFLRAMYLLR